VRKGESTYHHPLTEQQSPKPEFRHVKPLVPPHVASVETAVAGVVAEVADEATEVAEEGLSEVLEDDETLTMEVDDALAEEMDDDLTEKVDILRVDEGLKLVKVVLAVLVADDLTVLVEDDFTLLEVLLTVDDAALVLVLEAAPLAVRYQFVDGSPRHSPNVTAL
jgi:hypothetical protein